MPRILVSGGSGFIGSHLIQTLLEDNKNEIISIDKRAHHLQNSDRFAFIEADIRDPDCFTDIGKIDEVFHLAAQTSSIISEKDPRQDITTNIIGTLNICRYASQFDCRFTFASSMAIYGGGVVNIDTRPAPRSTYGISKLAAEQLVRKFFGQSGKFRISRLFNVYGPGQDLANLDQGMLSIFVAMALQDNQIIVKGSELRTRDFIHVNDVVMHWVTNKFFNRISNVASGESTSVGQLVNMIQGSLLPQRIPVIYENGFREDVDTMECIDSVINNPIYLKDGGLREFIHWAKTELKCM